MNEYYVYAEIPLTHPVQPMAPINTFSSSHEEQNNFSTSWNHSLTMSNNDWEQNSHSYPELNQNSADSSLDPPLDEFWMREFLDESNFLDEESSNSTPLDEPNQKLHKCEKCGKEFPAKHRLKQHEMNHNKKIKCPVQGCAHLTAKARDMFKRHLLVNHREYCRKMGISPEPRPVCPDSKCEFNRKGFARKDHLTRHLKSKQHSKKAP